MTAEVNAIEFNGVSVVRDGISILEDVTTSVPMSSVTAIIGPNGAGKTTLLRTILGLMPYSGAISLRSRTGGSNPRLGYVPQRLDFDRHIPLRVIDLLATSLQRRPLWFGVDRKVRDTCIEKLERVQAVPLLEKPLGKLSGGELQRVQLAHALLTDPEILLLDEPVSGVDIQGEKLFCDMLEDVQRSAKLTMVMVSHDLSVVSRHAGHVICLNRTLQCAGPTPKVLTTATIAAVYGPHMGIYEHADGSGTGEAHSHGHIHSAACDHGHVHVHHHHDHRGGR